MWLDISRDLGIDWSTWSRRANMEGNVELSNQCQVAHKAAALREIGERARKCAFEGSIKTKRRETGVGPKGEPIDRTTETEESKSDAAMARLAAEIEAPEIHGKLAAGSSQTGQPPGPPVTIQILMVSTDDADRRERLMRNPITAEILRGIGKA